MAMKQCPICGEKYSETYKQCPFCEEEEALRENENGHRGSRKGRRAARSRQFNLITPTLIILIVIMAGLLVYLLYGSKLSESLSGKDTPDTEEVTDPVDQEDPTTPDETEDPDGTMPNTPDDAETDDTQTDDSQTTEPSDSDTDTLTYSKVSALPDGLALSTTDFTLANLGETATIKVTSGGSGSYTWVSEDDGIASVDSTGKVTAVSGGTVNVLVTDGKKKGTCIVRVKATGSLPSAPSTGSSGSSGAHKLNSEDFTRPISEGSYQLKVSGVSSGITWTSSNTSVATVDSTGKVTPVGVGTATITASFNGQTLSCIVRVPR